MFINEHKKCSVGSIMIVITNITYNWNPFTELEKKIVR